MNWKEDSTHTNHRRKKGRHNPNRGCGWSRYRIHWAVKFENKAKRRAKDRCLMEKARYDDLLVHIPKTNLWDCS